MIVFRNPARVTVSESGGPPVGLLALAAAVVIGGDVIAEHIAGITVALYVILATLGAVAVAGIIVLVTLVRRGQPQIIRPRASRPAALPPGPRMIPAPRPVPALTERVVSVTVIPELTGSDVAPERSPATW